MDQSACRTDRIGWADTAHKVRPGLQIKSRRDGLWKRRGVEKSNNRLFHPAWKSRKVRGIPTFPQPRLRLDNLKPDRSCATKTGHFNLLRTSCESSGRSILAVPSSHLPDVRPLPTIENYPRHSYDSLSSS